MFISVLELFKIGIGPSSSHTMGPMLAARTFIEYIAENLPAIPHNLHIRCTLKGSLAFTGKGHASDRAVALGLHGYTPEKLAQLRLETLVSKIWQCGHILINESCSICFSPEKDIIFDKKERLPQHPNGMLFELLQNNEPPLLTEIYFSIGGGFICKADEIEKVIAPMQMKSAQDCPYPFDSAQSMLKMSEKSGLSIAEMKRKNELQYISENELNKGLDSIVDAMRRCVEKGLSAEGNLPGGLNLPRRAKNLFQQFQDSSSIADRDEQLSAYAMAVCEENAAGHMVVTAPTNGAAGVIPAILYYLSVHEKATAEKLRNFLLTSAAIGGIIKHRSSISGAEVGCQGEVGSAASMAAAGLCAYRGGTAMQVENAAEIALEHHLGMTCDPVRALVQVPCIERNAFGAIKACAAAALALCGSGKHFMPLDNCIAAMKQTGKEMSEKFKETSLGGLAVNFTEC